MALRRRKGKSNNYKGEAKGDGKWNYKGNQGKSKGKNCKGKQTGVRGVDGQDYAWTEGWQGGAEWYSQW